MDYNHGSTVPVPYLPDNALAILARLRLPGRLRWRLLREIDLRRGSDRSGPRLPIRPDEWLCSVEGEL